MESNLSLRIQKYAELIIKFGMALKKGETIVITSPIECADFVHMCADCAYDLGAREVIVNWNDDYLSRIRYLKADDEIFDEFPAWRADFYNTSAENRYAWLRIDADDPEALSGVDPKRISRASVASMGAIKSFREKQMSSYFKWCIASAPSKNWAKKVFPDTDEDTAVTKLWDAILNCCRVYADNDPAADWDEHITALKSRVKKLNDYNFKALHYTASNGTDLMVELPEGHFWDGGNETASDGTLFCANIPTEEIFTVPRRSGVNGKAVSSKPLSINGDIAENFAFTFENGRVKDITAEKGLELLRQEISIDEGASYLGEAALVPYNSPISNSSILFYNTLFDENASCHFALGDAYPMIEGGRDMDRDELNRRGVNSSMTHVDFMVGTADMSIVGTTYDGRKIEIFKDGNFTF